MYSRKTYKLSHFKLVFSKSANKTNHYNWYLFSFTMKHTFHYLFFVPGKRSHFVVKHLQENMKGSKNNLIFLLLMYIYITTIWDISTMLVLSAWYLIVEALGNLKIKSSSIWTFTFYLNSCIPYRSIGCFLCNITWYLQKRNLIGLDVIKRYFKRNTERRIRLSDTNTRPPPPPPPPTPPPPATPHPPLKKAKKIVLQNGCSNK